MVSDGPGVRMASGSGLSGPLTSTLMTAWWRPAAHCGNRAILILYSAPPSLCRFEFYSLITTQKWEDEDEEKNEEDEEDEEDEK